MTDEDRVLDALVALDAATLATPEQAAGWRFRWDVARLGRRGRGRTFCPTAVHGPDTLVTADWSAIWRDVQEQLRRVG